MQTATCQRGAAYVGPTGTVGAATSFGASAFSSNNIRAAVTVNAAGDYVAAGATTSPYVAYAPFTGGGATALLGTAVNPRKVAVYMNTLFYTSAATPTGIFMIGTAGSMSMAGNQAATAVSASNANYPNTSPSSFVFQSTSVLWACDDGAAAASYGVWKLSGAFGVGGSFVGESEARQCAVVSSAHGDAPPGCPSAAASTGATDRPYATAACIDIAGQVEASVFVLYFVTAAGLNRLPTSSMTSSVIKTAGANPFRGVALVPVPPSPSQTVTASQTQTSTRTPSGSPTQTQTASSTLTASSTTSPSPTLTASSTQSTSQAPTSTQTQTPSATGTQSSSQSQTGSQPLSGQCDADNELNDVGLAGTNAPAVSVSISHNFALDDEIGGYECAACDAG